MKHTGAQTVGKQVRRLIKGSGRTTFDAQKLLLPDEGKFDKKTGEKLTSGPERIQDRYSFRAVPPVHGAAFEAVDKLQETLKIELNSATDNPLFDATDGGTYEPFSGANFHGQPLAVVIDYVKTALTGLALISNKLAFSLLDESQNFGLPAGLAADRDGGDSGLMIAQYAGAARVAEARILSTPASVQSISTSANQEDFVSMGSLGVLHLNKVTYDTNTVLAVELLCARRALQFTRPERMKNVTGDVRCLGQLGEGTSKVFEYLDQRLPTPKQDRFLMTDIDEIHALLRSGELAELVGSLL